MTREDQVLVVGAGSIGRRHMRNLQALGYHQLAACDLNLERLQPIVEELDIQPFIDYEQALKILKPQVVLICTPPIYHIPQARRAVDFGAHVLIEKPVSYTMDGVDELNHAAMQSKRVIQVAYNLRFHPGLQKIKALVYAGHIGKVLWGHVEVGQYLPDWRPWQDYRQSYTAQKRLGGGIILDASHEIDYVLWMLGMPSELTCMAGKVSSLDVDVEDCATILLRFADYTQIDIHMDFVQRSYTRSCKLVGETGTIEWNFTSDTIRVGGADRNESLSYEFSPNDMYVAELEHFFKCIDGQAIPMATLQESAQTLDIVLAAYRSAAQREWVQIG